MKINIVAETLFAVASIAHSASFDCAKASTLVENAICSDSQLSDLDDMLMQVYKKALVNAPDANRVKAEQRTWLNNVRNPCRDSACLKRAYPAQIAKLKPRQKAVQVLSRCAGKSAMAP